MVIFVKFCDGFIFASDFISIEIPRSFWIVPGNRVSDPNLCPQCLSPAVLSVDARERIYCPGKDFSAFCLGIGYP